ncbi:MAG: hypothetical protein ACXAEN_22600 [Candidatus Thorarchaeota archaeon]|jgi:hypothetical protein
MGSFTLVVDKIKDQFDSNWLTESQKDVMNQVLDARGPSRGSVLNIWGYFGVGKTFLGWNLSRHWRCLYTKSIDEIPSRTAIAILDDYPSSRDQNRRLLNKMKLKDISQLVVITEQRINDAVWSVELKMSHQDIAFVRGNLYRIELEAPDQAYENLWELVNACEAEK